MQPRRESAFRGPILSQPRLFVPRRHATGSRIHTHECIIIIPDRQGYWATALHESYYYAVPVLLHTPTLGNFVRASYERSTEYSRGTRNSGQLAPSSPITDTRARTRPTLCKRVKLLTQPGANHLARHTHTHTCKGTMVDRHTHRQVAAVGRRWSPDGRAWSTWSSSSLA